MLLKTKIVLSALSILLIFTSCEKFLAIKPNKSLVVPTSLVDLQSLLDNYSVMNDEVVPSLLEISVDDLYLQRADWLNAPQADRNAYIWYEEIFSPTDLRPADWFKPYQQINYANIALEGVGDVVRKAHNATAWDNVKGSALFFRAWGHYQLAQVFCEPYDKATASTTLGIPIRQSSDMNEVLKLNSVQFVYEHIINDLKEAIDILPDLPLSNIKTRPSKAAALALLARLYLQNEEFKKALDCGKSALELNHSLIDYNDIDTSATYPFVRFNDEVIFHVSIGYKSIFGSSRLLVDTLLLKEYDNQDIRKAAFFWDNNGRITYKGSFDGGVRFFGGIGTSELYLTVAECHVRLGQPEEALPLMRNLFEHRYVLDGPVSFQEYLGEQELLEMILNERRKELIYRGVRWSDLRRLNKDPKFAKSMVRVLGDDEFVLQPGGTRYVLPIPPIVRQLNGFD